MASIDVKNINMVVGKGFKKHGKRLLILSVVLTVSIIAVFLLTAFKDKPKVAAPKPPTGKTIESVKTTISQQEATDLTKLSKQDQLTHYYLLGTNYVYTGDVPKAKQLLEKAVSVGDDPRVYAELGRVQLMLGDSQASLLSYKKATALYQQNPQAVSKTQTDYIKQVITTIENSIKDQAEAGN